MMQTALFSELPADAALEALAAAQDMNIVHKILIKPASSIHEQVLLNVTLSIRFSFFSVSLYPIYPRSDTISRTYA